MIECVLALALQSAEADEAPPSQATAIEREIAVEDSNEAGFAEPTLVAESPHEKSPEGTPGTIQVTVPAKHQILISIEGQVGSRISEPRDFFPIKLVQPVVIDGVEVLPAGITGEGQVVHAEKAGFAGSAGELLLAARYLMHGTRRIELRSFKFIQEGDEILHRGTDNIGEAFAAATVLGPLGLFIGGGNTTIEPGTAATAKFRNEEVFEVIGTGDADPQADQNGGEVE